jgi:NTE family protein
VPFDDSAAAKRYGALVEGGLPVVLAQTIRSVIHSRMQIGMRQYADDFKGADVVLIEPSKSDTDMFFTNAFSYASRRRLCEHAYQKTRADLLARRHELGPKLARHGITLNIEVLKDKSLTLVKAERRKAPKKPVALSGGTTLLKESLEDLARYVKVATAKQAATRKAPLSRGR